jgi:hypothetical protein
VRTLSFPKPLEASRRETHRRDRCGEEDPCEGGEDSDIPDGPRDR